MLANEAMTRKGEKKRFKNNRSLTERTKQSLSMVYQIPGGHIASLDVARCIASFFIVIGHVGVFYNSADYAGNIVFAPLISVFYHIRRLGLPVFLFASGFLFARSLSKGNPLIPRFQKAFRRLSRIFLAWTFFYIIEPVGNPHLRQDLFTFDMIRHYYWQFVNAAKQPMLLLLGGSKYHLWFLPALITSIIVIVVFLMFRKERYLPLTAIVFYMLSLGLHQDPLAIAVEGSKYYVHLRSYCQSFAFVIFGWWFAQMKNFSLKTACQLIVSAILLQAVQDMLLLNLYHQKLDRFMSIGLLPAVFGIFIVLMKYPDFGKNTVFHRAGRMTLGIYILHPFIIDVFELLDRKVMLLDATIRDLTFPVTVAVACLFVTRILAKNILSKKFIT